MSARATALLGLLLSTAAFAQAQVGVPEVSKEVDPPRNFVNLRAGGSSFSTTRPEICLEAAPLRFLSVEACGTGSGFLHQDPAPELAHFRAKLQVHTWQTKLGYFQPELSLGFAELQMGEDGAGFQFSGVGPHGVETAGLEAGVGVRALWPLRLGLELVGSLGVNGAWMPHAPKLARPMTRFQPSATLTVGVGF